MSKAACKCKEEECECPEWIFTFADLVMLMMGFFVILWVLKPAPGKDAASAMNEEWMDIVIKIREAFDYLPDPTSKDPIDQRMLLQKLDQLKPHQGPGDGGKTQRPRQGAEGTDPEVTSIRPGKQAVVGGKVLFEIGSAKLSPASTHALSQIAQQIRGHRNVVLVKGHTSLDDFADGTTPEAKMDLSLRRAQAAADYLVSHGVEAEILRVQGCSTFEPVIQKVYTPTAQADNRRVEVEASATLLIERQESAAPASRPEPATHH